MKQTVPLMIAAATGFVLIVSYFIPYTETWGEDAMAWFNILAAVAFILGGANLIRLNLQKISDRRPGWGYAAVTLLAFMVTLFLGLFKVGVQPMEAYPQNAWASPFDQPGSPFAWIVEFVLLPLLATMFALLAFFVASAAFRAFRAKNAEASVLLGTAFIVLLGRTNAGLWLSGWVDSVAPPGPGWLNQLVTGLRLDRLTEVIMDVFNTAGMRAIKIGVALGIVSTSLRVLLGIDRSYLGGREE
jgi:hypothetical protein